MIDTYMQDIWKALLKSVHPKVDDFFLASFNLRKKFDGGDREFHSVIRSTAAAIFVQENPLLVLRASLRAICALSNVPEGHYLVRGIIGGIKDSRVNLSTVYPESEHILKSIRYDVERIFQLPSSFIDKPDKRKSGQAQRKELSDALRIQLRTAHDLFSLYPYLSEIQINVSIVEEYIDSLVKLGVHNCATRVLFLNIGQLWFRHFANLANKTMENKSFDFLADLLCNPIWHCVWPPLVSTTGDENDPIAGQLRVLGDSFGSGDTLASGALSLRGCTNMSTEVDRFSAEQAGEEGVELNTVTLLQEEEEALRSRVGEISGVASTENVLVPLPLPLCLMTWLLTQDVPLKVILTKQPLERHQLRAFAFLAMTRCVEVGSNDSLRNALRIAQTFRWKRSTGQIETLLKSTRIRSFVKKGNWQIGLQMANTEHYRIQLYLGLREEKLYEEAAWVYNRCGLDMCNDGDSRGGVPPVLTEQVEEQRRFNEKTYLLFPLEMNAVSLVHDMDTLREAAVVLLSPLQLQLEDVDRGGDPTAGCEPLAFVGVDSEWAATIDPASSHQGADLLQIATPARAYLFDLIALAAAPDGVVEDTQRVLGALFGSMRIVKVAWDFSRNDLSMLRAAGGGKFSACFSTVRGLLELSKLELAVIKKTGYTEVARDRTTSEVLSHSHSHKLLSLSDACRRHFGRDLNKTAQCSDWKERPLTLQQIVYAAMDAHCLLGILDDFLATSASSDDSTNDSPDYRLSLSDLSWKYKRMNPPIQDKEESCESASCSSATSVWSSGENGAHPPHVRRNKRATDDRKINWRDFLT